MINKRAQAAMEFLMTYGWALLVVLIAIGALAFFGVLSPSKFLPNSCVLSPGFACTDFKASGSDGKITVVLQNGLGENLGTVGLWLEGSAPNCNGQIGSSLSTFTDGATNKFETASGCAAITGEAGSKLKADLVIIYTPTAGGLTHKKVGQLVVGVEA